MLFTYLFRNPAVWTFPLLVQILCYYRILGKMGHTERYGSGLYLNVPGIYDMKLFESAVKFFK